MGWGMHQVEKLIALCFVGSVIEFTSMKNNKKSNKGTAHRRRSQGLLQPQLVAGLVHGQQRQRHGDVR